MISSRPSSAGDPVSGSSADGAADVPEAEALEIAREICLSQLASSPKSRAQLETVLKRRGTSPEIAAAVLDRLEDVRLVDDSAFAETFVQTRRASTMSRRALGYELRSKGVSGEVVTEALDTLDPEAEIATARALVARKMSSTRTLASEVRVRRLVGMLARKGYSGSLAQRVVREAIASETELDDLERALQI